MRLVVGLVAALALAGTAGAAAPAPSTVVTLAESPSRITRFAIDDGGFAWANKTGVYARTRATARTTHVTGLRDTVLETVVAVALAGERVLYAVESQGIHTETHISVGSVDDDDHSIVDQALFDEYGIGDSISGAEGDGDVFFYSVSTYEKDPACAEDQGETCFGVFKAARVMRITRGRRSVVARASSSWFSLAVPDVAIVSRTGLRVQIRRAATNRLLSSIVFTSPTYNIALARSFVAARVRCETGICLQVWRRNSGKLVREIPLPPRAGSWIAAEGNTLVYTAGRDIRAIDLATFADRRVAHAAYWPRHLSIDGGRVAWVEHVGKQSRIRAATLR